VGNTLSREYTYHHLFFCVASCQKSLKAFLVDNGISPPLIHNLVILSGLCASIDKAFDSLLGRLTTVDQFYMPTRYPDAPAGMGPGWSPTRETAREVLDYGGEVFEFCSDKVMKGKDKAG